MLGNNILDLCTKLFPLCMKYNFDEIVSGMFSKDGIKSLASMINEVDSSADELSVKEDIKFYFRSYLVMLYSFKVLDQDKLVRAYYCTLQSLFPDVMYEFEEWRSSCGEWFLFRY